MKLRCLPVIVLTVALLTGCTAGQTSRTPSTSPTTEQNGLGGSGGPESAGGSADFPVKPVPNAIQLVTYNSAAEIPGPGTYMLDLTTGKVEAWQHPGTPDEQRQVGLSEDRRWAIVADTDHVYWANWQTGQVVGWNPGEVQMLAAGKDVFLLAGASGDPRKFYITDGEFQLKSTFSLEPGEYVQAKLAPDGKSAALRTSDKLQIVDVATGRSHDLGAAPIPAAGKLVATELLGPASDELVISYVIQIVEPTGLTREQSIVRRYSWQGRQLGELTLSGRAGRLSPDGRLLVSDDNLDHLTDAVVVTDLSTGQPRFRVLAATAWQWIADGSRFVLEGRNGSEYLVSTAGELSPAPPIPKGGQQVFGPLLMPAPDDPHRFLSGLTVFDDSGRLLQSVQLPKGNGWLAMNGGWGANANELVVQIRAPMGKGLIGFDFPLPPQVQKPPFDSPFILRVQDPQGECLNLRDAPSRSSRVIRCLLTGTKLAVGDPSAWEKPRAAWEYSDEQIWLWARTEQGETGWVSLSSNSVMWTH